MVAAVFIQQPVAEWDDQAGLLGQRYEVGWRDKPFFWIVPAQQHLAAEDPAADYMHLWLVVQHEFTLRDRAAQSRFQFNTPICRLGQRLQQCVADRMTEMSLTSLKRSMSRNSPATRAFLRRACFSACSKCKWISNRLGSSVSGS